MNVDVNVVIDPTVIVDALVTVIRTVLVADTVDGRSREVWRPADPRHPFTSTFTLTTTEATA